MDLNREIHPTSGYVLRRGVRNTVFATADETSNKAIQRTWLFSLNPNGEVEIILEAGDFNFNQDLVPIHYEFTPGDQEHLVRWGGVHRSLWYGDLKINGKVIHVGWDTVGWPWVTGELEAVPSYEESEVN